MGFFSRLLGIDTLDAAQRVLAEPYEAFNGTGGIPVMDPGTPLHFWVGDQRSEVEAFWRSQPNLRKVVDFIARNVASIPMNAYERAGDTERVRLGRGDVLGKLLATPGGRVGPYRFWHAVVSDMLLYDRWCLLLSTNADGDLELVQVPSWRIKFDVDPLRRVTAVKLWAGDNREEDRQWVALPMESIIFDYGFAPRTAGLSPVETLRDVLDEAREAIEYRRSVWDNGVRVPGYISRPSSAPAWDQPQRERFAKGLRAVYGKDGPQSGGIPLLEDGMEIKSTDVFVPKDTNDLEGRRLSAIEVATAFHIAPELVGAQQGNYSNVREFRQMLYRDSLGPYIKSLEDALNAQLVPLVEDSRDLYIEANVESKLRGSFEEQAQILQTSVGGPYMSRAEARARMNLPFIEGTDDLIVPLNVLTGGQASPTDSGSQNEKPKARRMKARSVAQKKAEQAHADAVAEVLSDFFARQEKVLRSKLGAKAAEWWDGERWDEELAADLFAVAQDVTAQVAASTLKSIGFSPDEYDVERTIAWLEEVSSRSASSINDATRQKIEEALDSDDPPAAVDSTFEAQESRSSAAGTAFATTMSGFAAVEAASQVDADEQATKTWVTGPNPRPEHARMDGETVPLSENFSNSAAWPGDGANLGADDLANCNCSLSIQW